MISKYKVNTGLIESYFKNKKDHERSILLEQEIIKDEEDGKILVGSLQGFKKKSTEKNMIMNVNRKEKLLKEELISDVLFESYFNSIVIDVDVKEKYRTAIKTFFNESLSKLGGLEYLESLQKDNSYIHEVFSTLTPISESILLKEIRLLREGKIKPTNDVIELEKEDVKEVSNVKDDLNVDEISDIVKDKVISVIQSETEAFKREQEKIEDLKNELEDNFPEDDDKELSERFELSLARRNILKEDTIFSSILYKNKVLMEQECNKSKDIEEYEDLDDEEIDESVIDLDMIMADTIIEYTLMEYFNTIGITKYTNRDKDNIIDDNKNIHLTLKK